MPRTDLDRLAADLHEQMCESAPKPSCGVLADRLIALGWTRLDEERLARALALRTCRAHRAGRMHGVAAAIAKAYREDAG